MKQLSLYYITVIQIVLIITILMKIITIIAQMAKDVLQIIVI